MKRIKVPYAGLTRKLPLWPMLMITTVAMLLAAPPEARAQSQAPLNITIDSAAATGYTFFNVRTHIFPANTQAGKTALASRMLALAPNPASAGRRKTASVPSVPAPGFYPEDLVYFGGAVLTTLKSHDIYVDVSSCGSVMLCWGNPESFLRDLGKSNFIHLTDQYTGTAGRYAIGGSVFATQALFTNVLSESEILGIVHAAVHKLGNLNGYGHMYHVFLPQGVDTCFDRTSICYSPDNPASFYFCAYHGSVDYSDIGHVIVSVEPYQNVPGCQAAPPNPNGQLADSTNSVLSHELFEAVTDPDPGSGWISYSSLLAAGAEIGDLCEPLGNGSGQFLDSYLTLNGRPYEVELEYSNQYHACAGAP